MERVRGNNLVYSPVTVPEFFHKLPILAWHGQPPKSLKVGSLRRRICTRSIREVRWSNVIDIASASCRRDLLIKLFKFVLVGFGTKFPKHDRIRDFPLNEFFNLKFENMSSGDTRITRTRESKRNEVAVECFCRGARWREGLFSVRNIVQWV
ncbi:hypothetical protein BDZ97DRAFT_1836504 [Flammula alnicola]|nr:hypothetical protein BDZ97DRAFT_1836504 [Flammula alnicola]